MRKLARRPARLRKDRRRAWPEVAGVVVIGLGLTLFPWHLFQPDNPRPGEATRRTPAASHTQTFGNTTPPCTKRTPQEAAAPDTPAPPPCPVLEAEGR